MDGPSPAISDEEGCSLPRNLSSSLKVLIESCPRRGVQRYKSAFSKLALANNKPIVGEVSDIQPECLRDAKPGRS